MCDCYMGECIKCGKPMPIHLADFKTARNEIEIYCDKCMPLYLDEGVLWAYKDFEWTFINSRILDRIEYFIKNLFVRKKEMYIKCLTKNAKDNYRGNCPNVCGWSKIIFAFGILQD